MVDYYILRNSTFASSANVKIIYTIVAFIMASTSKECFIIYTVSTSLWSLIEYILVKKSIRKIQTMLLHPFKYLTCLPHVANKRYVLSTKIAAVLRGSVEGGFITTFSLYWTDNINKSPQLFILSLLTIFSHTIGLSIFSTPTPTRVYSIDQIKSTTNVKNHPMSVRHLNNPIALVFLSTITLLDFYYLLFIEFSRTIVFLFIMITLGSSWTIAHTICNTRQILYSNIRPFDPHYSYTPTVKKQFFAYMFDIVVEIGLAYLPFYFITQMLL